MPKEKIAILIVEDEPSLLKAMEHSFSRQGYEVLGARNGKAALAKARMSKPALIILDILMPIMGGLDVLKKIRLDPDIAKTPVLVLSNVTKEASELAAEVLKLKPVEYLIKSNTPMDVLLSTVNDLLEKKK